MSKYKVRSKPIRELAQNPDPSVMADALSKNTEDIQGAAPNIAQSLKIAGSRAINYLHSKMPKPTQEMIGDADYEAPLAQQTKWLDLHNMVSDPVSALDHIRNGTLTNDHMDALNNVHPELLQEMQQKVMENMQPDQVKGLPTTTKIALSKFLGQPIASNLTPQAVMSNQASYQTSQAPAMQAQNQKSTLGGLSKLDLGARSATETQDLEEEPT